MAMPRSRGGLGKGLDALFPASANSAEPAGAPTGAGIEVPIEAVEANPRQPRHRMDPEQLADLAGSIREHGIIQPLIVTRAPGQGTRYQLYNPFSTRAIAGGRFQRGLSRAECQRCSRISADSWKPAAPESL